MQAPVAMTPPALYVYNPFMYQSKKPHSVKKSL